MQHHRTQHPDIATDTPAVVEGRLAPRNLFCVVVVAVVWFFSFGQQQLTRAFGAPRRALCVFTKCKGVHVLKVFRGDP